MTMAGAGRVELAMKILELATVPGQLGLQLLKDDGDAAEVAAELEDVANRLLDISEGLMSFRRQLIDLSSGASHNLPAEFAVSRGADSAA